MDLILVLTINKIYFQCLGLCPVLWCTAFMMVLPVTLFKVAEREGERKRLVKVILKKVFLGNRTGNHSLAMKILNATPRPILPSLKAWLEMASDNHSQIFTTLLQQNDKV